MKAKLIAVLILVSVGVSGYGQSLSGKEIFMGNCKACHSIGGGDLVGPDLAGVTSRRDADWIKSFITNSQKLVSEGDETAVELFNQYNKIAMPPHSFNDEEMNKLVSYMEEAGIEAENAKKQAEAEVMETPENTEEALAETSSFGSNIYVNSLLGILGFIALILSVIAIYLGRLLRS